MATETKTVQDYVDQVIKTDEANSKVAMFLESTGKLLPFSRDYFFEIARGNVAGLKVFSIPGRKDGISATVLDDLTQVPSTTVIGSPGGVQLEVVSSSDEDGAGTQTGINSVTIHYLDTNDDEQSETVTLNGTTPVDTIATDIDFIQWMHAKTVGSNTVAVGNISLRTTNAATTFEYITAEGNQSLSGRYKVPRAKTGYVTGWQGSGITKIIDLRLRATVMRIDRSLLSGVFLFQDVVLLNNTVSGWINFEVPLKMPSSAIIKMSAVSSASGGDAAGQFDIILVDD